jgi:glycosyltransferase involved in cell wall biosynthesis
MIASRRILLVADPHVPVPPVFYGGVERIVDFLAEGLKSRGWDVTLACNPNSTCEVNQVALRDSRFYRYDRLSNGVKVAKEVIGGRYDVIHSFGHPDLAVLFWPTSRVQVQSFQALPALDVLEKRTNLLPRKKLWFTTCGRHMVKHLQHLAPTRAIHNGVRIDRFTFKGQVKKDAPLVFLGRIEEIKGVHLAIDIAKATGRRLLIAGNRAESLVGDRYFKERIEPHLSEGIAYIGEVDDVQKNRILGEAAAFLMPILWDEPFGIVMAEALACGTPVIGFARGALPEIVADGVTGACCSSIDEIIGAAFNWERFSREACRQSAEERFSSEQIVSEYIDFYESILAQGARS